MRESARRSLYERNKDLIQIYAHSFNKQYGLDVQDLVSVGEGAFMEALKSKPKELQYSFRAWFRSVLSNRMIDYAKKTDVPIHDEELEFKLKTDADNPYRLLAFKDALNELSSDARYIVDILLTSPCEVLEITGSEMPKIIRGAIIKHCRRENWSWSWIWSAFKEIKEMLNG